MANRNEWKIKSTFQEPDVVAIIKSRRLVWLGHVLRGNIFYQDSTGRRPDQMEGTGSKGSRGDKTCVRFYKKLMHKISLH